MTRAPERGHVANVCYITAPMMSFQDVSSQSPLRLLMIDPSQISYRTEGDNKVLRVICKSKIENATITRKALDYSGSIGIDRKILDACNVYPNEAVQVLNANNGNRFETYVIGEKEGSGIIALYGPAARLGEVGDTIVILSYGLVEGKEATNLKVKILTLDKKNHILKKS